MNQGSSQVGSLGGGCRSPRDVPFSTGARDRAARIPLVPRIVGLVSEVSLLCPAWSVAPHLLSGPLQSSSRNLYNPSSSHSLIDIICLCCGSIKAQTLT